MSDRSRTEAELLAELRDSGEAIGKLAQDPEAFGRTVEAFRARDAERFQAELARAGLLPRCRLVCRWLCSKHCVFICRRFCGPIRAEGSDQPDVAEMREFALVTQRISQDDQLLRRLLDAIAQEDEKTFQAIVSELKLERFCHQLCHWLCLVRCQQVCELLCPPPPLITEVGLIPTSHFDVLGYASGPSFPPGLTPNDDKPAGVGDHPLGGWANIRGVFNVAGATQYKVEYANAPGGPWTPILQAISDYRFNPGFPPPPIFLFYTRAPSPDGWYNIAEMGLLGPDYLTDWPTHLLFPNVESELLYQKLTVRTAALVEFESPVVPVRIDNRAPTTPDIQLQLVTPDGTRRDLPCCAEVKQERGNKVAIKLQASDANFSRISVVLQGGCGVSLPIVDTGGTPLSKTYNGNLADTGYPALTEFIWDPWAAKVDPCCYLIYVRIWDRVIGSNTWAGGHGAENWHSITIA